MGAGRAQFGPHALVYMAPEQTRGGTVDPRTDIFQLGLVLYEMLTGIRMRNTAITFGAIARVLEQDPLLAPQVIRKANSAALGGVGKIETLRHAISRLGFAQLRTVLIELSAHKVFKSRNSRIRNAFKGIWEHSLAVAVLSREVASRVGGLDPEVAYLAGLLHDVGKPVVATIMKAKDKQRFEPLLPADA